MDVDSITLLTMQPGHKIRVQNERERKKKEERESERKRGKETGNGCVSFPPAVCHKVSQHHFLLTISMGPSFTEYLKERRLSLSAPSCYGD